LVEIIPFDPDVHIGDFRQMNIDSMAWHCDELENYGVDGEAVLGMTVEEYVDDTIGKYLDLRPPEGVVYVVEADGEAVGMLALTKLSDDTGELHRMWVNPGSRGKGQGKPLLHKVLEAGRELGCSTFKLSTPRFAHAAQHIYRSAGFMEVEEYPESEVQPSIRQHWIYMEKRD
jgi:GNAT superfamily N-acetyltransferase